MKLEKHEKYDINKNFAFVHEIKGKIQLKHKRKLQLKNLYFLLFKKYILSKNSWKIVFFLFCWRVNAIYLVDLLRIFYWKIHWNLIFLLRNCCFLFIVLRIFLIFSQIFSFFPSLKIHIRKLLSHLNQLKTT
jgi:hypothetical protein